MISKDFEVKLIDFGISKELSKTSDFTTCEKGSIFYEPPENTLTDIYNEEVEEDPTKTDFGTARKISKAYDIWSFGLILSEIFSGESPWGEELKKKPNQILLNLMSKVNFPIPNNIKDPKLVHLIKNCTEIYPKYRIEVREAINKLSRIIIDRLMENATKNKEFLAGFTNSKKEKFLFAHKVRELIEQSEHYDTYIYIEKNEREYLEKVRKKAEELKERYKTKSNCTLLARHYSERNFSNMKLDDDVIATFLNINRASWIMNRTLFKNTSKESEFDNNYESQFLLNIKGKISAFRAKSENYFSSISANPLPLLGMNKKRFFPGS